MATAALTTAFLGFFAVLPCLFMPLAIFCSLGHTFGLRLHAPFQMV